MFRSHLFVEYRRRRVWIRAFLLTSVVENLLCNRTMSARYISTCRLPTNRLTWRPVMSPAATCRGKRHLRSCGALAWHEAGTAQQELAHNPPGGERGVGFFLFFFFGGGWVCSWAGGFPRAVGCTTENLQGTAGNWGGLACRLIMLCPLRGLRESVSACKLQAMALGEGMWRNKCWLRTLR